MGKWIFHHILSVGLLCSCGRPGDPDLFNTDRVAILQISGPSVYVWELIELGRKSSKLFTLVNSGRASASSLTGRFTVSAFSYAGGRFPGTHGTCVQLLPIGTSCQIDVEFAPTYNGVFEEAIRIEYYNATSRVTTQSPLMRGTGIPPINSR